MTIEVVSNEKPSTPTPSANPLAAASAATAGEKEGVAADQENASSAPAEEAEQKESGDSETQETETKEGDAEPESAESHESDAPKDEASDKTAEPKKKSGFQKRIDKLNQRVAAKEQEAEYWKREALNKSATAPKPETQADFSKAAAAEGEPQPEQFDDHKSYVKALAKHEAKQLLAEERRSQEKSRQETEQAKRVNTYQEKAKAFLETHPDFDEVVEDLRVSPVVLSYLQSSEIGPDIAYELGKHPEEAKRLLQLSPIDAAVELGAIKSRITSKASGKKTPETKRVSSAPAPISPVGGSGKTSAPKTLEEAAKSSYSEYKRMREEQLQKQRRRA